MKHKVWVILGTFSLVLALCMGSMNASWAVQKMADFVTNHPSGISIVQSQWYKPPGIPVVGCTARPKLYPPQPNIETVFTPGQLTLSRFRQIGSATPVTLPFSRLQDTPNAQLNYQPREEVALANPTNFGERYRQDVNGQPVANTPIIVIHETVIPAWKTVKIFQTPHPRDEDQASYHTLVKQDGTIFYMVPPDKRAFGAGNSVFVGESVKTNRLYPPSVNNFAYHISFETPPDGENNGNSHSGYTDLQYRSLAWLVAKTGVPDRRITTHKAVDRSGTRKDPRSFDGEKFRQLLSLYPKTQDIKIGCPESAENLT